MGRELGAACLKRGRGERKRENGALESVFERGTRGGQQTPALGLEDKRKEDPVVSYKEDNGDA